MNTDDFNNLIKPLADKWVDDLVKDGLFNKDETNTMLEQNNTEVKKHYCPISPEQYEKLYKEKEILKSKIDDLYPYCSECGAEYDYVDKPCCPNKSISYTHPRLLHKLKVSKFYLQKVSETNQIVNMEGEVYQYPVDTSS